MKKNAKLFHASFFAFNCILLTYGLYRQHGSAKAQGSIPVPVQDSAYHQKFLEGYQIMPPALPGKLDFAGEAVPLDFYLCRERLDREVMVNIFWQSNQLLLLKRANRYFPEIESILKEYGVPEDFKYLCLIESGMMNVVSPAGAAGFWQLMPGTARDHGLEVNAHIDERYNLEKATRAACEYILLLHERFGSWTLAAAAYNTGQSNMDYHLRTQSVTDYYQLYLPEETSRYVYRILAEKLIVGNPGHYGLHIRPQDLYPPLQERKIKVDTTINDLFAFARQQGVTYQMLKLYNPWIRGKTLPDKSRRTYYIALPPEASLPSGATEGLPSGSIETLPGIPASQALSDSLR